MTELNIVNIKMLCMFFVWIGIVVLIIRRSIKQGIGLPTALVLTYSFLYGGCFVYAVPGYTHIRPGGHWYLGTYGFSEATIVNATFVSIVAIFGFAIGCGALKRFRFSKLGTNVSRPRDNPRMVLLMLGTIAVVSYLLHYAQVEFPLSGALLECGRNLALVFVCLGMAQAKRIGLPTLKWILLAALIPAYYLFVWGFVSYGFLFVAILVGFWFAQVNTKWKKRHVLWYTVILVATVWAALTLFVGWFSFRDEVRGILWLGNAGSAFDVLRIGLTEIEVFSLWNFEALDIINIRLNLNIFIGKMMEEHALNPNLREYGATLVILPLVFVPRFLWPGKPTRGGSELMSEQTGLLLSETSTFGTGSVFEFYMNFGLLGVFFGFVFLGFIIARIDRRAASHLETGNYSSFARLLVVGIVAIDPLLRPFFILNGAVFAWIVMTILKVIFDRLTVGDRRALSVDIRNRRW